MLLPTMPSALMLLHLGSLSNLMMTNTAVFLICSLPKTPNNYLGGEKMICLLPPAPPLFFFLYLKKVPEEGNGRVITLGQDWP